MTEATTRLVRWDRLQAQTAAIFQAVGSSQREAVLIADHLVEANLRGHDSHGVGVVPMYLKGVASGGLVLNQSLKVALDTGGMLICDAAQGAGQVMAHEAMALGINRAAETGSAIVSLRNSHHIGRIGHWAEQCAEAGMVSIHFVNVVAGPIVAPFGGTRSRLGTNPFAAAFPRAGAAPVVVDFATSTLAAGKVRVAHNKGVDLPPGARVVASSDFTPFGMLAYDEAKAVSIQLHPEFQPDYAKALIETRRGTRYTDEQADAAIATYDAPDDRARLGAWIQDFLKRTAG